MTLGRLCETLFLLYPMCRLEQSKVKSLWALMVWVRRHIKLWKTQRKRGKANQLLEDLLGILRDHIVQALAFSYPKKEGHTHTPVSWLRVS